MQTFVVLLHSPPLNADAVAEIPGKLKAAGFEVYSFSDNAIIARAESALSREVASAAGLSSAGGMPGIVFKLNRAYSGFAESSLWEWLDMHGEGSAE